MKKVLFFLIPCLCLHAVVITYLRGQLGNQLFQVAAAVCLAEENQCPVHFADFEILNSKDWQEMELVKNYHTLFHRLPNRLSGRKIQPVSCFYERVGGAYAPIPYVPYQEINGFFQSEKFFAKYESLIRELYKMPETISATLQQRFPEILAHPKTVAIHVRTGYEDYRRNSFNPKFYASFCAPDLNFYQQAIEMFDEDSLFVVCSDHISWCKKNFSHIPRNFVFIETEDYFLDFYLLTLCKDIIIANSTFGWWAAYLNEWPTKRVVCRNPFAGFIPAHAPADILCENWIKINMPSTPPPVPIYE